MIPTNRPVLGRDLDDIKQQFGLSTADACWLFGMSITKWTHVCRQGAAEPVTDPTLALLVRFLDLHPELSVVPKLPDAMEIYTLVNSIVDTDQKRFSILVGSEASATYRWRKHGSRQSPTAQRLMYCMKMSLLGRPDADKLELLDEWEGVVKAEGQARGVDDVFRRGYWSAKSEPEEGAAPAKRILAAKSAGASVKPGMKRGAKKKE